MPDVMICIHCEAPAEIDPEKSRQGEIHHKPCGACGGIGIRRQGDLYQQMQRKKTNVLPYDRSPYRGGKKLVS